MWSLILFGKIYCYIWPQCFLYCCCGCALVYVTVILVICVNVITMLCIVMVLKSMCFLIWHLQRNIGFTQCTWSLLPLFSPQEYPNLTTLILFRNVYLPCNSTQSSEALIECGGCDTDIGEIWHMIVHALNLNLSLSPSVWGVCCFLNINSDVMNLVEIRFTCPNLLPGSFGQSKI